MKNPVACLLQGEVEPEIGHFPPEVCAVRSAFPAESQLIL